MVHDSMRNLKIDKRLLRRQGWIESAELERELEALPDASPKGELVEAPQSERAKRDEGA